MFRGLVNDAKAALSSLVLKYLARASVAAPFLISLGFALAATTLTLIERFGSLAAYRIMAGGLAVVGILAAVLVSAKEQDEELAGCRSSGGAGAAGAARLAAKLAWYSCHGILRRACPGPELGLGASARGHRGALLAARESECGRRRKHRRSWGSRAALRGDTGPRPLNAERIEAVAALASAKPA